MKILQNIDTHEKVVRVEDKATGLIAYIAIHSTLLGPATGGCRLFDYETEGDALADTLRLSKGMTYKNAIADVGLGGGKSVIMGPLDPSKREAAFIAFGRAVHQLGGDYIAAEDVGVSVNDIHNIAKSTKFATGLGDNGNGFGGDPAPYTALGVLGGIKATAHFALKRSDLEGVRIAIQGIGSVGSRLCKLLSDSGAKLVVADIDSAKITEVCDLYQAEPSSLNDILLSDVDIIAPCAMGRAITVDIAKSMRAVAIAGAANNQLASPLAGEVLFNRQIAYAPDYVINAGGIIMAGAEYLKNLTEAKMTKKIDEIYGRILGLHVQSKHEQKPSYLLADKLAEDIFAKAFLEREVA
ncbi:MAG: amino acid dehydrogenase [Robiginitomaculum sp.]|nr:MAG: amino acid dehydrogenase [Robiginitomaculum sp.]